MNGIITITKILESCLKCPLCGVNSYLDYSKVRLNGENLSGSIFCKKCKKYFKFEDGILITDPSLKRKKNWDKVYENSIKGSFVSNIDDTINVIASNINVAETYLPVVKIFKNLSANGKVETSLEVGCGTGTFSLTLKKLGLVSNVILLDSSYSALKVATTLFRRFNEKALFILADGLDTPLLDRSVSLVFSAGLIEHFDRRSQKKLIIEQARISRGKIICQVPINSFCYRIQRKIIEFLNRSWPFGYEKPVSIVDIRKFFEKIGLTTRRVEYHDIFTAFMLRLSVKVPYIKPITKKYKLNEVFKTEAIFLLESRTHENRPETP